MTNGLNMEEKEKADIARSGEFSTRLKLSNSASGNGGDNPQDEHAMESPISRPATTEGRMPSLGRTRLIRTPVSGRRSGREVVYSSEEDESQESVLITEPKEEQQQNRLDRRRRKPLKKRKSKFKAEDIDKGELWDTDLDIEDEREEHDISGRSTYMKVCEKLGIVPASYFLRHITSPYISMRYHGLGVQGTKAIAKVLKNSVTTEHLNLTGNWMEEEGALHIARMLVENDYITDLNLSENRIGSKGCAHITNMLKMNTTLHLLDLSGNQFTDLDSQDFAEIIEDNKYLREVNLGKNGFGDAAGQCLGPAIGANDVLEHLDLSWNHLRLSGAVAIARGLKENVRLKSCNLAWNGFGHDGGLALADALAQNETLTELDITGNRLDTHVGLALARALAKNEQLQVLRMGNNPINTIGTAAIGKSLAESETSVLAVLDLTDIPVEYEYLRLISEVKEKRDFHEIHGPEMRSANDPNDLRAPAMDPHGLDPATVLKHCTLVKDTRLYELLKKFDPDNTLAVTPEEFAKALKELQLPFNSKQLEDMTQKMDKNVEGKIFYGDLVPCVSSPEVTSRSLVSDDLTVKSDDSKPREMSDSGTEMNKSSPDETRGGSTPGHLSDPYTAVSQLNEEEEMSPLPSPPERQPPLESVVKA